MQLHPLSGQSPVTADSFATGVSLVWPKAEIFFCGKESKKENKWVRNSVIVCVSFPML